MQRAGVDRAKQMIADGIKEKLDFKNLGIDTSRTFRVVDFGCSVGNNTLSAVENIIEAAKYKHQLAQLENPLPLEFQIFFNDVTSNDFNTLFKLLPTLPKYFAAAVPGSFYGRLFPRSSIHCAHSSYAMHWLSKIPKEIVDSKSPAWNKGKIHCSGHVKEVVDAYSGQFRNDMETFLNARAQEIVGGGLMAMVIPGFSEGVNIFETGYGAFHDIFSSCLNDMAKLGLLEQEQVDSFNLAVYHPYVKEVEETIKKNDYFSMERIEEFCNPLSLMKPSVKVLVSSSRAVTGELLKKHFGNDAVVDQIYEHLALKLEEKYCIFDEAKHHSDIFILLKRRF
ncbi:hypothetical protein Tsubulata_031060 [Turnera subulata]|uniref:S-adenosylmethionine-dependent methyltransferase At5g38100 n=1 Tax=Turnera subulata TaxID=218843 RepID=A0A9Q0JDH9_9ROSI|nr:hypothetical protein Tsubulata_031060 [Turnera subulata]